MQIRIINTRPRIVGLLTLPGAMLGAGIISGAGSLLGSAGNTAGSLAGIKLQQKYNKEMYAKQVADERLNATTAYERQMRAYAISKKDQSYEAQKEQMKAAGLNPALMYSNGVAAGKGGAGDLSTQQKAGVPSALGLDTSGLQGLGNGISEAANLAADTALKVAQAKNIDADTGLKPKQGEALEAQAAEALANASWIGDKATGQRLQNDFDKLRNKVKEASTEHEIERLDYQTEILLRESEIAYERAMQEVEETERKRATTEDYIKSQRLIAEELVLSVAQKGAQIALTKAEEDAVRNSIAIAWDEQARRWQMNLITDKLGTDHNRITESLGEKGIKVQKRGQNLQLAGNVIDAITDFIPKPPAAAISGGSERSQTTRKYDSEGKFTGMTQTDIEETFNRGGK